MIQSPCMLVKYSNVSIYTIIIHNNSWPYGSNHTSCCILMAKLNHIHVSNMQTRQNVPCKRPINQCKEALCCCPMLFNLVTCLLEHSHESNVIQHATWLLPYNFILHCMMHIWFHIHVSLHQYMGGMQLASTPLNLTFIVVDCAMLGWNAFSWLWIFHGLGGAWLELSSLDTYVQPIHVIYMT
jgi:hypothetical protein